MRAGDTGRLCDGRMRHRQVLDFDRADPLAPRLDNILAAVGYAHETVPVDGRYIAGWEPAVDERRVILLEIPLDHPRTARMKFPERDAVPRQIAPIVADNLHVHAVDHV